jgi:hypothetical protein
MWRWLAQSPSGPSPSVLEAYGPGGVIAAICLGFTWIMFRRYEQTLDLERQRSAKAEEELRELNRVSRELTIPAVTKATEAITEAMRVLRKDHPS